MGIDGSCRMYLKFKDKADVDKFVEDFIKALDATKCDKDVACDKLDGNVVNIINKDDRSFFIERWVFSIMLERKKTNDSYYEDYENWGKNFVDISRKYKAIVEVWAEYDSNISACQHSIHYYGETLLEEQKPFTFIDENSSEEEKAEEAFYEKIVPNFKNYGKMTI